MINSSSTHRSRVRVVVHGIHHGGTIGIPERGVHYNGTSTPLVNPVSRLPIVIPSNVRWRQCNHSTTTSEPVNIDSFRYRYSVNQFSSPPCHFLTSIYIINGKLERFAVGIIRTKSPSFHGQTSHIGQVLVRLQEVLKD
jgi:hypothetical protein